jgi:hypothetical protein
MLVICTGFFTAEAQGKQIKKALICVDSGEC